MNIKMKKLKFLSFVFVAFTSVIQAQDLQEVKKSIDAEQFEKAKGLLKSLVKSNVADGEAFLLLGNTYLVQNLPDSAKIAFESGLKAKKNGHFNNIGLAQLSLDKGDVADATAKFDFVKKEMRKKDFQEYIYIARAYMTNSKPDFKSALAVLELAKEKNGQEPQVQLAFGDAFYGDKNQNEAYKNYRDAFQADASLIRAKMKLGVLLKGAKAYTEAVAAYDNVIALAPNYGPVYRELAETYYYWGNNQPAKYNEYIKKAVDYYEKYMSLTDYSLASRMRHADFLILAKDYKALEIEANKMKELDKVNPRIFRYLGYASYENGNYDAAIESLNTFVNNPKNKTIAQDFMFLGQAKIKKGTKADGTIDSVLFGEGVSNMKKAVELESDFTSEISAFGKTLYQSKSYKEAAVVFELTTTNKSSKSYLLDNFYLGNSIYFENSKKDAVKDPVALQKADVAFGNVIEAAPKTLDAYVYRARTQTLLDNDELMIKYYSQYVELLLKESPEVITKAKNKLIEAYNTMGAGFANTDKVKAVELFNKTLAIDAANVYALQSVQQLK